MAGSIAGSSRRINLPRPRLQTFSGRVIIKHRQISNFTPVNYSLLGTAHTKRPSKEVASCLILVSSQPFLLQF